MLVVPIGTVMVACPFETPGVCAAAFHELGADKLVVNSKRLLNPEAGQEIESCLPTTTTDNVGRDKEIVSVPGTITDNFPGGVALAPNVKSVIFCTETDAPSAPVKPT